MYTFIIPDIVALLELIPCNILEENSYAIEEYINKLEKKNYICKAIYLE